MNENTSLLSNTLVLALQLLIIYYLKAVQGTACNCLQDWRGTVIMLSSLISACFAIINIAMPNYVATLPVMLWMIVLVLQVVNTYSLFTYVGDLNETKCGCAVQKHPMLNNFMRFYRWVPLVVLALFGIIVINRYSKMQ